MNRLSALDSNQVKKLPINKYVWFSIIVLGVWAGLEKCLKSRLGKTAVMSIIGLIMILSPLYLDVSKDVIYAFDTAGKLFVLGAVIYVLFFSVRDFWKSFFGKGN